MNVKYYLCEDIRQEVNGKVMLIGLYPDNKILLSRPDKVVIQEQEVELSILPKLQIMICISDFEGEVEVFARFTQPDKKTKSPEHLMGKATIEKGMSHLFITDCSNFPAVSDGTYTFTAKINGTDYDFPMIIVYQD